MLARKAQLQSRSGGATAAAANSILHERLRLTQARTLAIQRQDYDELAALDAALARLGPSSSSLSSSASASASPDKKAGGESAAGRDPMAQVNERNRRANMESVRRAEVEMQERKRRALMARRGAGAGGGSATPTPGTPGKGVGSRPGTPNVLGTPTPASARSSTTQAGAEAAAPKLGTFEASLVQSIEIDLGDF